jgi:hypothetical protein
MVANTLFIPQPTVFELGGRDCGHDPDWYRTLEGFEDAYLLGLEGTSTLEEVLGRIGTLAQVNRTLSRLSIAGSYEEACYAKGISMAIELTKKGAVL